MFLKFYIVIFVVPCFSKLIVNESYFYRDANHNVSPSIIQQNQTKELLTMPKSEKLLAERRDTRIIPPNGTISHLLGPTSTSLYQNSKSWNGNNGPYIDYKQKYGLRYRPNNRRQDFISNITYLNQKLNNNYSKLATDEQINETIFLQHEDISATKPFVAFRKNITKTTIDNNVMKPSRIQKVLEFLVNKLTQLIRSTTESKSASGLYSPGKRFLNLFNIVRFQNDPCTSTQKPLRELNGTCYHQLECEQLGGVGIDGCASGFGVCCVFQLGCGGTTRQNISYFENPGFPSPIFEKMACTLTVILEPAVQQVLLEFIFFELRPPTDGFCVDDQFVVSGQSMNFFVPVLCGINTGQHMYIDVSESPDRKLFLSIITMMSDPRAFSIRISQLTDNLAPQNCLQYYTEATGVIQTFNYEDASSVVSVRHPSYFNNLNYAICIRRNVGFCTISYTNEIDGLEHQFQLANIDEEGLSIVPPKQAGAEIFNCADDYIAINGVRLCGEKLNDGSRSEDFTKNFPVMDYSAGPILVPVRTNTDAVGRGFKLAYEQNLCEE